MKVARIIMKFKLSIYKIILADCAKFCTALIFFLG